MEEYEIELQQVYNRFNALFADPDEANEKYYEFYLEPEMDMLENHLNYYVRLERVLPGIYGETIDLIRLKMFRVQGLMRDFNISPEENEDITHEHFQEL